MKSISFKQNVGVSSLLLGLIVVSCTTTQPPFECGAQNNDIYQVRYYSQSTNCPADGGFITASLVGQTAGMQTYMLISPDGGGGPAVVFRDDLGNLDRSATKLGLRLNSLLEAKVTQACDDDLTNNCTKPDPDLACTYCVVGDGTSTSPYTLPDGKLAEDAPLADGGSQGVEVPLPDGGSTRISLSNACDPGRKDDVTRNSAETPDPNLFLMLPRYGDNGVCRALDTGITTSTTVFPKYTCEDGTTFDTSTIKTKLSNFALVASSTIPGNLAKGTLTFEETNSSGTCTSVYKVVIMNPIVQCVTDLDCSPDPVPDAPRCTGDSPATSDYCYTGDIEFPGLGASNAFGSGMTPFLFGKFPDGGYDLRNTCDPVIKRCIWDSDAGS